MNHEEPEERAPEDAEESNEGGGAEEESGPDVKDLNEDPAYNPQDEDLKGIKGG